MNVNKLQAALYSSGLYTFDSNGYYTPVQYKKMKESCILQNNCVSNHTEGFENIGGMGLKREKKSWKVSLILIVCIIFLFQWMKKYF
jgi:hypothetical protein